MPHRISACLELTGLTPMAVPEKSCQPALKASVAPGELREVRGHRGSGGVGVGTSRGPEEYWLWALYTVDCVILSKSFHLSVPQHPHL